MRIGLVRPAKHSLDVACALPRRSNAWPVVPERIAHISVLIECFVDHIPGEHLPFVVLHYAVDMFVQKARQLPDREMSVGEPRWVVATPDQAMATNLHLMRLREANQVVATVKVVGSLDRPQHPPLHRIFRLDPAELAGQGRGLGSCCKL